MIKTTESIGISVCDFNQKAKSRTLTAFLHCIKHLIVLAFDFIGKCFAKCWFHTGFV